MFIATLVDNEEELKGILSLQQKYLRGVTGNEEEAAQGFLTVAHTLSLLKELHRFHPSIIVKSETSIAGYALVMLRECRSVIPVLVPMFDHLDKLSYKDKLFSDSTYYVMGQVCVDKSYRSQGIFDMLYQKHKEVFSGHFNFVVTEISTRNLRSLNAHKRIGFKTIDSFKDQTDEWEIVLWDWS
jgi:hypothetical protein